MHACKVASVCNPMDCSPPGSSVYGISQASILEWVAISFSKTTIEPAIPLLGIYSEETKIEKNTCTPMFIAALLQQLGHGSNLDVHRQMNG